MLNGHNLIRKIRVRPLETPGKLPFARPAFPFGFHTGRFTNKLRLSLSLRKSVWGNTQKRSESTRSQNLLFPSGFYKGRFCKKGLLSPTRAPAETSGPRPKRRLNIRLRFWAPSLGKHTKKTLIGWWRIQGQAT